VKEFSMADIPEPLRSLLADDSMPRSGETWRHHEGGEYRVVALSTWQPNPTAVVITIRSLKTGVCETLPLLDFLSVVDPVSLPIPRYKPVQ
jgi:hypothetical protein